MQHMSKLDWLRHNENAEAAYQFILEVLSKPIQQPVSRLKRYTNVAEGLLINGNEIIEYKFRGSIQHFEILELYNANDEAYKPVRDSAGHIIQLLRDGHQLQTERKDSNYTYIEKGSKQNEQSSIAHRRSFDHSHMSNTKFDQVDKGSPPKRNSYDDAGTNKLGLKSPPKLTSFDFGTKLQKEESMTESLGTTPIKLKAKKNNPNLTDQSQSTQAKTEGESSIQEKTSTAEVPGKLHLKVEKSNSGGEKKTDVQIKPQSSTQELEEFGEFQESDASPEQEQ